MIAKPDRRTSMLLVLAGMVFAIVAVQLFEHVGGYIPCQLCLQQREPYYAAIPLGALALAGVWLKWPSYVVRCLMAAVALLLLYTMVLGGYHSGVEWGWWTGPADCGATAGNISTNVGDLLGDLSATRPPSCTEAAGRFLGLSFAGWNFLAAAAMALLAARAVMLPSR